jgi:hypothetical protein
MVGEGDKITGNLTSGSDWQRPTGTIAAKATGPTATFPHHTKPVEKGGSKNLQRAEISQITPLGAKKGSVEPFLTDNKLVFLPLEWVGKA